MGFGEGPSVGRVSKWHQGELFPRVGFIVTNLSYPTIGIVRFYNGRGTAEQWIKEGKPPESEMAPRTPNALQNIHSPYDSPHFVLDHLAALTSSRVSRGYLRIPCPAHSGTNPNLALWVNNDGIAARCYSAGCSYADIAAAILDRYGTSINPKRYHNNPITVSTRVTTASRTSGHAYCPGPGRGPSLWGTFRMMS